MGEHPRGWLRLLAWVVPAARRERWLREWHAEMTLLPDSSTHRLRLLDAAEDAARLRWREGILRPLGEGTRACGQDIRYAARALASRPGYLAAAALAFALGIGANTAIFSVVSGVLLHPLPYSNPDELVIVWSDGTRRGLSNRAGSSPADYLALSDSAASLDGLAALVNGSLGFTEFDEPLVPLTHYVTSNFFDVLGSPAALGRTFRDEDDDHVVIVSHQVWRQALEGDPAAIGRTVVLDEEPYVVVGVMPPDFYITHQLPVQPGLWVPMTFTGREDDRRSRNILFYGRLAAGHTYSSAAEELAAFAAHNEATFPETHTGWGHAVVPIRDNAVGAYRQTLGFMLLAVALILLLACANVANLGLGQALQRTQEVTLRSALGAGRARLLRQMIAEGLLLASIGAVAGLSLGYLVLPVMLRFIPGAGGGSSNVGGQAAVPFLDDVGINTHVLLYAVGAAALAGLLAGLAPAKLVRTAALSSVLRAGGRNLAGNRSCRMRQGLVAIEVSIAVVLVVAALATLQSVRNLQEATVGYDADRVLSIRNSLRVGMEPAIWQTHFNEARAALSALPGVEAASGASFVPPEFANRTIGFYLPGEDPDPESARRVVLRIVLPDYFKTLGIPIRRGRALDATDTADSKPVMVVNEAFRNTHFPGSSVLGERIVPDITGVSSGLTGPAGLSVSEWEIVGVVGDVRSGGADPVPQPIVYVPYDHVPIGIMNLVVRTAESPLAISGAAEVAIWQLGRKMNIYQVESLAQRLGNFGWQPRFAMMLLGLFAVLAAALGAAGVYAVIAYSVSQRRREMGVRIALGASRGSVVAMVVRDGVTPTIVGLGFGVLASIATTRWLGSVLYEVGANEPDTLVTVVVGTLAVAVAASLGPAWRASRADPVESLRGH